MAVADTVATVAAVADTVATVAAVADTAATVADTVAAVADTVATVATVAGTVATVAAVADTVAAVADTVAAVADTAAVGAEGTEEEEEEEAEEEAAVMADAAALPNTRELIMGWRIQTPVIDRGIRAPLMDRAIRALRATDDSGTASRKCGIICRAGSDDSDRALTEHPTIIPHRFWCRATVPWVCSPASSSAVAGRRNTIVAVPALLCFSMNGRI